jgi:hypothetical protein
MKHNRHIKWIVGATSLTLLGAIGLSVQASPQQHNTGSKESVQNQDQAFFGMRDDDGFGRPHHRHDDWNDDDFNEDGQMRPDDQMMMPDNGQMMPQDGMRSQAS